MQQDQSDVANVRGWTSSPQGRGSLDVLLSCLFTVALCSWSAVSINIPAPGESFRKKFVRKLWLTWVGILAPEFLFLIALGQWTSARRATRIFKQMDFKNWTTRHGFYVDMGGFVLADKDGVRTPLSNKSLQWLITHDFIPVHRFQTEMILHENVIEDRNTSDTLIRLVAWIQALYFCIRCGARIRQGLQLTTLELLVLAFLVPTAGTFLVWRRKPCDINTSYTIALDFTYDEMRERAGVSNKLWHTNPFDFCEDPGWRPSLLYKYWVNILKFIVHPSRWFSRARIPANTPVQRRSDSELHHMPIRVGVLEAALAIPYLAANFAAWNWSFPTPIERFLWRLCAIIMIATYCASPLFHVLFDHLWTPEQQRQHLQRHRRDLEDRQFDAIPLGVREDATLEGTKSQIGRAEDGDGGDGGAGGSYTKYRALAAHLRNNSPTDDPDLDIPLRLLVAGTSLAALYAFCRGYLLISSLIAFRSMPASVYETVAWLR